MNLVELTEKCIDSIHRNGIGVYRKNDVTLVYRLRDLYFIGWLIDEVFYCDPRKLKKILPIMEAESVGFEFKYDHLPMNKVKIHWVEVTKLLKSRKDLKCAVASVIVLTSESWRFHPIANACKNGNYTLCLQVSLTRYVNGLSEAVKPFNYTLRDLLNDWSKLSDRKSSIVGGKTIPFTNNDIKKIIRMPKVSKETFISNKLIKPSVKFMR